MSPQIANAKPAGAIFKSHYFEISFKESGIMVYENPFRSIARTNVPTLRIYSFNLLPDDIGTFS